MGKFLGGIEQVVLRTVFRMRGAGYGMSVRREIEERPGRSVPIGTIYATLDRLECKGRRLSGATAHREGPIGPSSVRLGVTIEEGCATTTRSAAETRAGGLGASDLKKLRGVMGSAVRALCSALMCLALPTGCAPGQQHTAPSLIAGDDEAYLDSLFVEYSGARPGASIMIAKGNELLLCKGYGQAQMDPAVPADCDTSYRLNSTSKQFTAMAILDLIDEQKLTLETTLTDVFTDFPEYGEDISVRFLLTHQSGLRDYGPIKSAAAREGRSLTDRDVLEYVKTLDSPFFTPGTEWHYSNAAYAVLATVVAELSGTPFEEYVREQVFLPAGMTHTQYFSADALIPNRALGYIVEDGYARLNDQSASTTIMGDGSVYTSARDFFGWHKALVGETLVASELHDAAYQPQSGDNQIYGFGWFTPQDMPIHMVEHGGASTGGFISFAIHAPELDVTVAVFTNLTFTNEGIPAQNLRDRARSLLSIATDGEYPMPDPADF